LVRTKRYFFHLCIHSKKTFAPLFSPVLDFLQSKDCCQAIQDSLRNDLRYNLIYNNSGASVFEKVVHIGNLIMIRTNSTIMKIFIFLNKKSELLLLLFMAILAFLLRISIGPMTWDDAYITFRYAHNIAEGYGFVYNLGERVLGTTTPLYTLLLASFNSLGLDNLPFYALLINACADFATTFLLIRLAKSAGISKGISFGLGVIFAISPLSVAFAASGMESSVFTFFIIAALYVYTQSHDKLSIVLIGLAFLTRPEALIAAACILLVSWYRYKKIPIILVALFLVMVIPWIVFSAVYFGSPIPHSIIAKVQHYPSSIIINVLWILADLGVPGFNPLPLEQSVLSFPYSVWPIFCLFLIILFICFIPKLIQFLKTRLEMCPFVFFAPGYIILLIIEGWKSSHIFPWYYIPLIPFYSFALAFILHTVLLNKPRFLRGMIFGLVILWTALGINWGRQPEVNVFEAFGVNLAREKAYIAAAEFLAPKMNPHTVVALPEIGAFGYYTNVHILDTAGLVSPESLRYYPLPVGYARDITLPPDLIRKELPDYIVVFERFLPYQLRDSSWFSENYHVVKTFNAPIWGSKTVFVYELLKLTN
jgi:hypothetical protein